MVPRFTPLCVVLLARHVLVGCIEEKARPELVRVLVVDDDENVRRVVRRGLEREGFEVVEAADGPQALAAASRGTDLAVLDVNMPGMSGLDVLAELRRRDPRLHVIMLTGAAGEADRVRGLVSGADDYMVKPFSTRELAARAIAVRRRAETAASQVLDFGALSVDLAARQVTSRGRTIDLTRREFDLLSHLATNPSRAFSRTDLLEQAWESSPDWQNERTITEHVRRLRNKIEIDPARPQRIVTVRGVGYRFEPDGTEDVSQDTGTSVQGSRALSASGATAIVVDGVIAHASDAALELLGASELSDVVGRPVFDFVAERSLGAARARHQSAKEQHLPRPEVMALKRMDGREVVVEIVSAPVTWEDRPASQLLVWDLGEDTARLRELATGIRSDVPDAVIVTDADLRIQSFNAAAEELYGWSEREVVGRQFAQIAVCAGDSADRPGIEAALMRDGRWHGVIEQSRRDGTPVTVRASMTLLCDGSGQPVGVVTVNRPLGRTESIAGLLASSEDAVLDTEIRRGLEAREFCVHYQPVVALKSGRCIGVEALVRWQHPEHGLLAPVEFIDAAERSGAIVELGQQVLEQATAQWATWRDQGIDLHVAVNVSGRQLADVDLPARLADILSRHRIPRGKLWLEVTETALVADLGQASEVLQQIADLGVHISIDDFGTGWASLTYLRQFPIHSLKIDRLFVSGLETDSNDSAIVASILSLGAELGLTVVAEGIETTGQADALSSLGCQLGQGYLYARPTAPGDVDLFRA